MNTTTSQKGVSQRALSSQQCRSVTPKMHYNGIHNYDTLRLRMSIDSAFSYVSNKRPSSASITIKRNSISNLQLSSPSPIIVSSPMANRYASIECCSHEDYSYSYFPSRYKYVKGKKRPVSVRVVELVDEQALSRKLQYELKIRQQKKKLQIDQKFSRFKEKYLEQQKKRKSALKPTQKPKAVLSKVKNRENEGLILAPWDNEADDNHGF